MYSTYIETVCRCIYVRKYLRVLQQFAGKPQINKLTYMCES